MSKLKTLKDIWKEISIRGYIREDDLRKIGIHLYSEIYNSRVLATRFPLGKMTLDSEEEHRGAMKAIKFFLNLKAEDLK